MNTSAFSKERLLANCKKTWNDLLPRLRPWAYLIMVGLIALSLYTYKLGSQPFVDYDEAAYAEVIRETAISGNIFTFKFAGEPWFDKPPFYFWAAMVSEKIVHPLSSFTPNIADAKGDIHPTEFTTRLPAALAGVLSVMLVWLIVYEETKNKKLATGAALILLATGAFIDNARQVRLDVPVTAAILATYYAFLRSRVDRRWVTVVWICFAIAFMIKSVIALFIVPVILIDLFMKEGGNGFGFIKEFFIGIYAKRGYLTAAILIVPWHLYQTYLYGTAFWNHYLFVHVYERFETNLFVDHVSVMQFFGWMMAGALPWSLIALLSIGLIFTPHIFRSPHHYRTFLINFFSAALIFMAFAAAQTKAPSYLVPMYPFIAIASAVAIESVYHYFFKYHHLSHTSNLVCASVGVVLILVALATSLNVGLWRIGPTQEAYAYAAEEKVIGGDVRTLNASSTVDYTTNDNWETVRFYSAGKTIQMFDDNDVTDNGSYYIVTPRKQLADTLHSPAVKFASNFKVAYLGKYLALIEVQNNSFLSVATGTQQVSALVY